MKLKIVILFSITLLTSGCYSSGYHPNHIMSDVVPEDSTYHSPELFAIPCSPGLKEGIALFLGDAS